MNRLERKAALAVAAAAAGVIVSGITLIKKHSKYLTQKAAATFDPNEEEDWFDEAEGASEDAEGKEGAAASGKVPVNAADDVQEEEKS